MRFLLLFLIPTATFADPCDVRTRAVALSKDRVTIHQKSHTHKGMVRHNDPLIKAVSLEIAQKTHEVLPHIAVQKLDSLLFFAVENAGQHGKKTREHDVTFHTQIIKTPDSVEVVVRNPLHATFPPALRNKTFSASKPVILPEYQLDGTRGYFGLGVETIGELLSVFPKKDGRTPTATWDVIDSEVIFTFTLPR